MRFGSLLALLVIKRTILLSLPKRSKSDSSYSFQSVIGFNATPESIAAFATAGATTVINLGSNGDGMIYSLPKVNLVTP